MNSGPQKLLRPLASVFDQGMSALVGFLVSIWIGHSLGLAALGTYAMTYLLVLAVHGVQNGFLLQAMSVFGPQTADDERPGYYAFVFRVQLASIVPLTLLLAVAAIVVAQWHERTAELLPAVLCALLYSNFSTMQNILRRRFYIERSPRDAAIQSSAFVTLVAVGLGALAVTGQGSIPRVYLVLAAASFAVCAVQWRGSFLRSPHEIRPLLARHWVFGRWILLSVPFVLGGHRAYYLIAGAMLSETAAGHLKAADTLVLPYEQIAVGLGLLFLPEAARDLPNLDLRGERRLALRLVAIYGAIGLAYAAAVLLFGEWVMLRIFTEDARAAASILPVFAMIPLLRAALYPASILVMSRQQPQIAFVGHLLATVTTLSAGPWLTARYGLEGAAAGFALAVAVLATVNWTGLCWSWRS
ncbi:MAG: lipopolysaccharide biosynthesis protein [bacterium]|nr:lipopolysaccharide biosynthesis protein [bacterium]